MEHASIQQADAGSLLTDQGAGDVIGVTARTIRDFRLHRGLPFIRITSKIVRIRRPDLDSWIARHQMAIMGRSK